jgi:predicted dehydrogenase/nucleoside-diphosphate-sugar epimerase
MDCSRRLNVAVIGTGFIADTHVQVLKSIDSVNVCAVCDVILGKAQVFAKKWGITKAYGSIEDLVKSCDLDVAHILVPPPMHMPVAEKVLAAGMNVLIEKPMALSTADCLKLIEIAEKKGAHIGVNHNFNYHPAFRRLIKNVQDKKIGRVQHVFSVTNMPMRQLASGDFSHWMFHKPQNIIFEQGPHIFSQIYTILGKAKKIDTCVSGRRDLIEGRLSFYATWQMSMECEKGTAQVFYSVGKEFSENRLHIIGQDGSMHLDMINNTLSMNTKTKWPEFLGSFLNGYRNSAGILSTSIRDLFSYIFSLLRLQGRSDTFYLSMKASIEAFYHAILNDLGIPSGGHEGLAVLDFCEKATAAVRPTYNYTETHAVSSLEDRHDDVLVTGGTGFIGRHLVEQLTGTGMRVRVMTRKPQSLPAQIRGSLVSVVEGDITDRESVFRAMRGIKVVYHLATGGGNTWKEMQDSMIGGLENVIKAGMEEGISKLFFTSTIAAYYCGSRHPITENTPIDDKPEKRGMYARAKIASEHLLMSYCRQQGLPVTIFRPAVVIGKGGIPQHSAIGTWVNDIHCFGWGNGRIPLPFVLLDDVVSALVNGLTVDGIAGKSFNLAGDVRLTAFEYVVRLGDALNRSIYFYPQSLVRWQCEEIGKWFIKRVTGRPVESFPSYRDLRTRTLEAPFDCSLAKAVLGWEPVTDLDKFLELGIFCHSNKPS